MALNSSITAAFIPVVWLYEANVGPLQSTGERLLETGCINTLRLGPLLPTRSEERGVLGVGSIHVAILQFCQDMKTIALYLHKH